MWNVEIISTEAIKPSSPTPQHLRTHRLSLLDQLSPPTYILNIFYYSNTSQEKGLGISLPQILKNSLSLTLLRYYPFAGRIQEEDDMVDCNDEGVEFSDARVHGHLSDLLKEPNMELLNQLIPCNSYGTRSGSNDVILTIQLNTFDCGGVAIGIGYRHKVADASTFFTFMKVWADITTGKTQIPEPTFESFLLFPPRKAPTSAFDMVNSEDKVEEEVEEKLVCKRFVFDKSSLDELKARISVPCNSTMKYPPSRTEALSALLWRCYIRARGEENSSRATATIHAVNLRGKLDPPLPEHSFGNIYSLAISPGMVVDKDQLNHSNVLERVLRDALNKVDSEHIRELQGPNGFASVLQAIKAPVEEYYQCGLDYFSFSSWWKFPFYEVDFGWGKPIWVSTCDFHIKNFNILIGTKSGDGIEAWVCIEEKEMAKFEQDQELLSLISVPAFA